MRDIPDEPVPPSLADDLLIDVEDGAIPERPRHPLLIAAALVLIALNLRPALSSLGPVLAEVVRDTGVSASSASILTTVPVVCLGVFGLAAPGLARRFGSERVILAMLAVLAAGIALRAVPAFAAQVAAALVAGAGIGVVGALLPGLVKRDFPERAALMTGVYTMALCGGAALAAGSIVPLSHALGGWPPALASWALPALVAAAVWLSGLPDAGAHHAHGRWEVRGLWRDPLAWQVTLFMGLQSSLAYVVFAWLAPILRDRGLDPVTAGFVVSSSILVQLITALTAPIVAGRRRHQGGVVLVVLALTLVGLLGCLYAPIGSVWLWAVLVGLGQGGSFALGLTLIVLRAGDPHVAAALSSMAQSVGYTLASCGPLLVGLLHDRTGGWGLSGVLFTVVVAAAAVFGVLAGRPLHVRVVSRPV
ncbi:CynX/NimT family MFS transporter [Azospirillum sp. TSO22-1]|uniref:CynX/NimT family MFS transporter n=1 Tax=Azospirillum sp. TSO22-1 TaxID=716789 RepID=UPI000D61377C|nr:CynX/NimT family MFS transporter [Azospirillum sp. TSO22-1]PWC31843.1 MFS transporter [Azospirillum sp. TSO22-1]